MADLSTSISQIAVCLKDCILVLKKKTFLSNPWLSPTSCNYSILIYNLWTEQWRNYTIPEPQELPEVYGQTGVVIGTDVYIFGGEEKKSKIWETDKKQKLFI